MLKLYIFLILLAPIEVVFSYESLKNKGLGKRESIDLIDTYLLDIAGQIADLKKDISDFDSRISKKIDNKLEILKNNEIKKIEDKIASVTGVIETDVLVKLKGIMNTDLIATRDGLISIKEDDLVNLNKEIILIKHELKSMRSIIEVLNSLGKQSDGSDPKPILKTE